MAEDGGLVGGGGSCPHYITDEDGKKWVMKGTFLGGQDHSYLFLNEGLSALLAHEIGVNVPQMAVVELTSDQLHAFKPGAAAHERTAFASALIQPREAISPESADECDAQALAGIVVFDAWIRNTDRKAEHVLAQETESGWIPWAVDHGHTLATAHTLAGNFDSLQQPNAPLDLLASRVRTEHLEPWLVRIHALDRSTIYAIISSLPGAWVVEPDAPAELARILDERADGLRGMLSPYFPALSSSV